MNETKLAIDFVIKDNVLIIHGEFNIIRDDELYAVSDLYRKLVMVMQYNSGELVFHPFEDKIILEDDVKRTEQSMSGQFHFIANDMIKELDRPQYYVLCSLGVNLSNILTVNLQG